MSPDLDLSSDEEMFVKYRIRRLEELKKETNSLMELGDEAELIRKSKRDTMIVHFYKKEFKRCDIMNQNLESVCMEFPDIEFYKIEAEKCSVVTERLGITVLPFLSFFRNGFFVDSVVGFEGLGTHWFEPKDLACLIRNSEIYR